MAAAPRQTLMQLWKRGWNEIPEVMGASFFGIIAYIGVPIVLWRYSKYDRGNRRYKNWYNVYRPDDPRAARVIRYEGSPGITSLRSVKEAEKC